MVIPPAKTGSLKTNKKVVTQTLTKNKGMFNHLIVGAFKLLIVQRKLTEPAIDLMPAKCRLKITISTLTAELPTYLLKGG
jgi:hypothetical protein